ncbi:sensor histidine kinase [Chitinophaga tropicalis]|uniref:Histidine kinase n=1 Tax=Chitinophaga tropicalis TaxID=2683588 RepID=A0A7K1UDT3_9BACT|nr:histidine kinase [Chitinophaga tropicalis]MVT12549.1 histidine kinase [Chitinophaga tropicalis]
MEEITNDTFLNNRKKRVLVVFFAFLLLYFVSYIIDPYSKFVTDYFKREPLAILGEWTVSFIFCFLISESAIRIHALLNKYLSWTERSGKRLVIEASLNLLAVLVIIFLDLLCFSLIEGEPLPFHNNVPIEERRGLLQWVLVSAIIAFMIIAINTGNYLILNWRNTAIEAAGHKLKAAENKQAAMEAELQALKLQIDPHFVFNNLSVLSELILENQQLGYEYAENFSKVYRYLLVNSRKDIILLEEELKFLNAYIFLIQHRAGNGVHFEIDIDKGSRDLYLPPLTLQLLIENALKHNKTIKSDPLKIRIFSNDKKELIVENKLIAIEKQVNSSGIGLQNIISRYQLLSKEPPEIIKGPDSFKVIIRLIKL